MALRVLVINPSRMARDSIVRALTASSQVSTVTAVPTVQQGLARFTVLQHEVIVLDVAASADGSWVRKIRDESPQVTVVVSGVSTDGDSVIACARAGAAGYIDRDATAEEWIAAIACAVRGEVCDPKIAGVLNRYVNRLGEEVAASPAGGGSLSSWEVPQHVAESASRVGLTPRERQIVALIDTGLSNKEIASTLNVEPSTVKNHVHSILAKYRVRRRTEAAARYRELNKRRPPSQDATSA